MPAISANDLRRLAERADSHRGVPVYLIKTPNKPEPYDITETRPGNPEDIVLEMLTKSDPPFLPRAQGFTLLSDPVVSIDGFPEFTINNCDAVFTQPAAMDKFLVQYYETFTPRSQIQTMVEQFASDPTALAVCHLPDSIERAIRAKSQRAGQRDGASAAGLFMLTPHPTIPSKTTLMSLDEFQAK